MLHTYQGWVETVTQHISKAVAAIDSLYADQDAVIDQLKAALARGSSLRHADFDGIFAAVLSRRNQQRAPLAQLADSYYADRQAILGDLRALFQCNVARAQDLWPGLKDRLLHEQETSTRQAVAMLRRMHVEQQELSAALGGLLSRGDRLRVNDLKTVANRLANRDSRCVAELADLLAGCESAARQTDEKWQKLAG
jgi:hypothetical protein